MRNTFDFQNELKLDQVTEYGFELIPLGKEVDDIKSLSGLQYKILTTQ